jgi:tetratricopeptide (TPR) repeat protein
MRMVCLFLLTWGTALGQEASPEPAPTDVKASHQYYDLGAQAYERADYPAALRAFEAAWAEAPNPELQFNIARCHEHMFEWDAAADAYQTYLASKPNAADAYEIKSRIAELRRRGYETAHPAPPPPPPQVDHGGLRIAAGATLGVTLALAAAGTGAYLSAWNEYDSKSSACAGRCAPETLDGLRTRVEIAQVSGAVLFSLAGVALITDVALWVLDAKARRR